MWPKRTAAISRRHHWFPRKITTGTSVLIPHWWRVTTQIWVTLLIGWSKFPRGTTNQKHYPHLDSDASSVWNFCSDVISRNKTIGGVVKCRLLFSAYFPAKYVWTSSISVHVGCPINTIRVCNPFLDDINFRKGDEKSLALPLTFRVTFPEFIPNRFCTIHV